MEVADKHRQRKESGADQTEGLWKTPKQCFHSKQKLQLQTVRWPHTKNLCLINPPRLRRHEEREGHNLSMFTRKIHETDTSMTPQDLACYCSLSLTVLNPLTSELHVKFPIRNSILFYTCNWIKELKVELRPTKTIKFRDILSTYQHNCPNSIFRKCTTSSSKGTLWWNLI